MDLANWQAQLRKGALELVILLLLREGEQYGYDLIRNLRERYDLEIAEGTLYPLFNRLAGERLIISKWVLAGNQRSRRYYSLTRKGRETLAAMLDGWDAHIKGIDRIIAGEPRRHARKS